jgi:hypothetical protein
MGLAGGVFLRLLGTDTVPRPFPTITPATLCGFWEEARLLPFPEFLFASYGAAAFSGVPYGWGAVFLGISEPAHVPPKRQQVGLPPAGPRQTCRPVRSVSDRANGEYSRAFFQAIR